MRPRRLLLLGWVGLIGLLAPSAAGQALEEGDIVVSDRAAGTVVRIRPADDPPEPTILDSGFPSVRGILADRFGSVFLTESVSNQVLHLDPDSGVIGIVGGPGGFTVPEDIVFLFEEGNEFPDLLVADAEVLPAFPGVVRLDAVVGNYEYVAIPTASGGFFEGLAFDDESGILYISDTATASVGVYRVDLSKPFADREIEPVSLNGGFITPKDVALEPTGTLLVADRFAQTVFRVDPTSYDQENPGANQSVVVNEGLQAPVGLYVYQDSGDFLLADYVAGAVYRYHSDGARQETYSGADLLGPWRVTVVGEIDRRAEFLVADTDEAELYRVEPDPADAAAATRTAVDHQIELATPAGIAVDTDGTVLLCDSGNQDLAQALLRVDPEATPGGEETVFEGEPLASPNRVVVHQIGGETVYFVADPGAGAILKVEGNTASVLEPPSEESNYLVEPVALAIDQDGLLVVLNRDVEIEDPEERAPLLRVSPESGFQKPLDLVPELIQQIVDPVDLAIDKNGDILLADGADPEQEVEPFVFRLDGMSGAALPKSYASEFFHTLEGIALDVNRELLVTDSGDEENEPAVIRVDATSGFASIVDIGTGQSWARPNGIALDQTADPPELADDDGDAVANRLDNCEDVFNPGQEDVNGDGFGDACQPDDNDGDGWPAEEDNCQEVANRSQIDTNNDGIGNRCDPDYNNDGKVDGQDLFILSGAWGTKPSELGYLADVDFNPEDEPADGIGLRELLMLSNQWLQQPPGPGRPGCDGTTSPCPAD